MKRKDWNWQEVLKAFALLSQLGLTMLANIGLGFLFGYIFDYYLHIKLTFKILGIFIGIISGFYSVYRIIIKLTGDENDL